MPPFSRKTLVLVSPPGPNFTYLSRCLFLKARSFYMYSESCLMWLPDANCEPYFLGPIYYTVKIIGYCYLYVSVIKNMGSQKWSHWAASTDNYILHTWKMVLLFGTVDLRYGYWNYPTGIGKQSIIHKLVDSNQEIFGTTIPREHYWNNVHLNAS